MPVRKSPSRPRLDQLDKNFRVRKGSASLQWIDAFDRRVALRGLAWLRENRRARNFRRLPDRAEKGLTEGVQVLSHCPAGVFLSFFSDSPTLSVRLTLADLETMDHMPATGMSGAELYYREGLSWIPAGTVRPDLEAASFTRSLFENAPRVLREYRLYLPLYKKIDSVAIGVAKGAVVRPAPAPAGTRPVFFYGTSITQGGCANTAGSDLVSAVGRLLDTEVVNFGFSGCGKGEPEMAKLIRTVDAEMFVLDFLANAEAETLPRVLPEFLRLLREKKPDTPVVLISCPSFNQLLVCSKTRTRLENSRDIAMRVYLKAREDGDRNIHFIDGQGLLPAGIPGAYVDGVHPTSLGFAIMAERLVPQLRVLRSGAPPVPL